MIKTLRGWLIRLPVLWLAIIYGMTCLAGADAKPAWVTDLPAAQARAKAENKLVLLDFTGSDWCPNCKQLEKNVWTTSEFRAYAKANLVLVTVDFPERTEQPEPLKKANKALQVKYGVEGFPTIILLDGDGKQVGKSIDYEGEKPKQFIEKLQKLKQKVSS